ncbi:MAG: hypothetical protein JJ971_10230 [Balneolaceae bacterium]|nr:hypothetical protein [Balneolaceae bacterium]MBO6546379.1 hypothetical protein [Balneolaceae bacterium]MBO6648738.1 hypothetical protein [Balneolaceae bacterium]
MNIEKYIDGVIPFIKKWWFSFILIVPIWITIERVVLALTENIMVAVNYPYPPLLGFFFLVIDNLDLILHEGGHTIFGFFGWRFLAILGGSLMAVLIPFLLFLTAWNKKQKILAQACLFQMGYSTFVSAVYCADAYHKILPLIGNDESKAGHDYANMLSHFYMVDKNMEVAWIIFAFGVLFLLLCLIWPLLYRRETEYVDLSKELEKSGLN